MPPRSRQLTLRSGAELTTPILVPSVTSKGFLEQEIADALEVGRDLLTDALLVSAYDLHHRKLPDVDGLFGQDHWSTIYGGPRLLVVDSGGYELGQWLDDSELVRYRHDPKPFSEGDYRALLAGLPRDRDLLAVSFDHVEGEGRHLSYPEQIAAATQLFGPHPGLMTDLLLKPPEGRPRHAIEELTQHIAPLAAFHVVGVTERELGDSLGARMAGIAGLREAMDVGGITAPIHVFGVLEPVLVALYYYSGAELFDGLTWLRYGLHNATSINRSALMALADGALGDTEGVLRARAQSAYLVGLREWARSLRFWAATPHDFAVLNELSPDLAKAISNVIEQIGDGEA